MADLLRFKDMLPDGLVTPEDSELDTYIKYRRRRMRRIDTTSEQIEEPNEALNIQQRMARGRLMKRLKSKIKVGRDRAKRKMADKSKLERRAQKAARKLIFLKITKGVPKEKLPYARRQEIEKRLDKPQVKKRIQMLAKRMFKDIRKKEVERKKG
tara:strand:- start:106 stop:570 length:465 start_codon:yes stop_codon:yes gene_type:complete